MIDMTFVFILIFSIGLIALGYIWGSKEAIRKFLEPTCGMSIEHDQYSGAIESITYYYSDRAYQEKIQTLKYQDCEEINDDNNI